MYDHYGPEVLSDKLIDALIKDHWRELKGLLREKQRRQQTELPDTNEEPLDSGCRDGRTA